MSLFHKILLAVAAISAVILIAVFFSPARQMMRMNRMGMGKMGSGMMGRGSGMMGGKGGMMGNRGGTTGGQSGSNWQVPETAAALKNPLADDPSAWKEGKAIFASQCVACHGERGLGDGIVGKALNPRPANLTSPAVQQQSDGAIYYKITEGRPPMPAFKGTLTDEQRWQVVKFIRTLANN